MLLHCCVFFTLLSIAACQSTDQLVKKFANIDVDKKCVEDKIGLETYYGMRNELKTCVQDIFKAGAQLPKGSAKDTVAAFCEHYERKLCPLVIQEKLSICLNDHQKNHLKYTIVAVDASKAYSCADDAKTYRAYLAADRGGCTGEGFDKEVRECFELLTSKISGIKIEDFYKEEFCQVSKDHANCYANVFKSCSGEVVHNFILNRSYASLNVTPCAQYVSKDESQLLSKGDSGGSDLTFNLNLIVVASVILLCMYFRESKI